MIDENMAMLPVGDIPQNVKEAMYGALVFALDASVLADQSEGDIRTALRYAGVAYWFKNYPPACEFASAEMERAERAVESAIDALKRHRDKVAFQRREMIKRLYVASISVARVIGKVAKHSHSDAGVLARNMLFPLIQSARVASMTQIGNSQYPHPANIALACELLVRAPNDAYCVLGDDSMSLQIVLCAVCQDLLFQRYHADKASNLPYEAICVNHGGVGWMLELAGKAVLDAGNLVALQRNKKPHDPTAGNLMLSALDNLIDCVREALKYQPAPKCDPAGCFMIAEAFSRAVPHFIKEQNSGLKTSKTIINLAEERKRWEAK